MDITKEILTDTDVRMKKSVESLKKDLGSIRTGRASPELVEGLIVDYYGSPTPLNQLASISVPEARMLQIQPWDKQALGDVERSILKSDLSLTPNNDGTFIRINIPILTEERRKELVRIVGSKVEDGRIAVRNIRRDTLEQLRGMQREKGLSQDESRRSQEELQQITDQNLSQMSVLRQEKEIEVMEVGITWCQTQKIRSLIHVL